MALLYRLCLFVSASLIFMPSLLYYYISLCLALPCLYECLVVTYALPLFSHCNLWDVQQIYPKHYRSERTVIRGTFAFSCASRDYQYGSKNCCCVIIYLVMCISFILHNVKISNFAKMFYQDFLTNLNEEFLSELKLFESIPKHRRLYKFALDFFQCSEPSSNLFFMYEQRGCIWATPKIKMDSYTYSSEKELGSSLWTSCILAAHYQIAVYFPRAPCNQTSRSRSDAALHSPRSVSRSRRSEPLPNQVVFCIYFFFLISYLFFFKIFFLFFIFFIFTIW